MTTNEINTAIETIDTQIKEVAAEKERIEQVSSKYYLYTRKKQDLVKRLKALGLKETGNMDSLVSRLIAYGEKEIERLDARASELQAEKDRMLHTSEGETTMAAPKGNSNAKKKSRTRTPVVLSIGDDRLSWVIAQLGIDDPTDAQIIRFVKDFCYGKIDEEVKKMEEQEPQEEKRQFYYTEISLDLDDLSSHDWRVEASKNMQSHQAFSIKIVGHAEYADAFYDPITRRLGIAWGADPTWADVDDVDSGIEMWLNDGEEWERRN